MIGYVARDKNGQIYLHREAPVYEEELYGWYSSGMLHISGKFPEFNNMSYKDDAIKVEIKLERI